MLDVLSPAKKLRRKRWEFEQRDVWSSIGKLRKAPKGYSGYVASKRPTVKYGGVYYKVHPYSIEPSYQRDTGGKVIKTTFHKQFYGSQGVEWVKRRPSKRLYELEKESDYR